MITITVTVKKVGPGIMLDLQGRAEGVVPPQEAQAANAIKALLNQYVALLAHLPGQKVSVLRRNDGKPPQN